MAGRKVFWLTYFIYLFIHFYFLYLFENDKAWMKGSILGILELDAVAGSRQRAASAKVSVSSE